MKQRLVNVLSVALVVVFNSGQVSAFDSEASCTETKSTRVGLMATSSEPFTIVAIPDTQVHAFSPSWFRGFADHTSWIRDHVTRKNIVFVTHLGDVVQGEFGGLENFQPFTWQEQLERADAALDQLDAINQQDGTVLPYSVSLGNHDLLPSGNKLNPEDPLKSINLDENGGFRTFFGATRYEPYRIGQNNPYQWYGGSDVTEWNHYQLFQAGPYTYLHINLEWEPENPKNDSGILRKEGSNDALTWAQSVIDAHPGVPTIISSHKLLTDLEEQDNFFGYAGDGVDEFFGGERTLTGQTVWDQLVTGNPQIFMTLNGHEHEGPYRQDGEYHQVSTNDAGLSVFEILVNHQDYYNLLTGNDPYLRLIEFDPQAGQIRNKTFSPTLARFAADPDEIEMAFFEILDNFDKGLFVPILEGEDIITVIAPLPLFEGDMPETRDQAAGVVLEFFGASNVEELRSVAFSPWLTDADSQFSFDVGFDAVGRPTLAEVVPMNIHPFRCSNTLTTRRQPPFIPVAILGSTELSAKQVDHSSLKLEGVNAYKFHFLRDVGKPVVDTNNKPNCKPGCEATKRDGFDDLLVFFNRARILKALGDAEDKQALVLRLTGNLKTKFGGYPIVGEDVVVIKEWKGRRASVEKPLDSDASLLATK